MYIDNVLSHMPPEATGSTSSSNPPQIRIQIVLFKIIILPGACDCTLPSFVGAYLQKK